MRNKIGFIMAWPSEHKQNTREKIVLSAAKLFTTHGFNSVGINEIMEDAGLTRGAFYSHFKSKTELYAQSIPIAGREARNNLLAQSSQGSSQKSVAEALVRQYLSLDHCEGKTARCPLAYLATDISQRNTTVRTTYTEAFKHFVQNMKMEDSEATQEEMLRKAVLMIGGLAISRALNDKDLIEDLFSACQNGVLTREATPTSE